MIFNIFLGARRKAQRRHTLPNFLPSSNRTTTAYRKTAITTSNRSPTKKFTCRTAPRCTPCGKNLTIKQKQQLNKKSRSRFRERFFVAKKPREQTSAFLILFVVYIFSGALRRMRLSPVLSVASTAFTSVSLVNATSSASPRIRLPT